jgi:uncharacterized damage-inducible protein DinB
MKIFEDQYQLVRESRTVVFKYCESISPADFTKSVDIFGRGGSIRNLLTHNANTYKFWIGQQILNREMIFSEYEEIKNIRDIKNLFEDVNQLMKDFFRRYIELEGLKVQYEINGVKAESSLFRIFTHVITHEFHHKGQILSLSRKLGYIPVDTDIMR